MIVGWITKKGSSTKAALWNKAKINGDEGKKITMKIITHHYEEEISFHSASKKKTTDYKYKIIDPPY